MIGFSRAVGRITRHIILGILMMASLGAVAMAQSAAGMLTPEQLQQLQMQRGGGSTSLSPSVVQREVILEPTAPAMLQPQSELEHLISIRAGAMLRQFGYDQLGIGRAVSLPQVGAVQDNYILGVGDEIVLTLRGQENSEYHAQINRDGNVNFPRINPISAAGRSLGEFRKDVITAIRRSFVSTDGFVTVGQIRQINVFVSGEVGSPGVRTLTGLSTVSDAIFVSGGIKKSGSLRNVQIHRGGRVIVVDLYNALVGGAQSKSVVLADGDRIVVPALGGAIAVAGEVRRPAIYELPAGRGGISVREAVRLANGMAMPGAYTTSLLRTMPNGTRQFVDVTNQENFTLRDGEIVVVKASLNISLNQVKLKGAVRAPGVVALGKFKTLHDLLPSANVMSPAAYTLLGFIDRTDPVTFQRSVIPFSPLHVIEGRENMPLKSDDVVRILTRSEMLQLLRLTSARDVRFAGARETRFAGSDTQSANDLDMQGNQGMQGNLGLQGNQGLQGNLGLQGNQGMQGNQGLQGPVNGQGMQNPDGSGYSGFNGVDSTGASGFNGIDGNGAGLSGFNGAGSNMDGQFGMQGARGAGSNPFGANGMQDGANGAGANGTYGPYDPTSQRGTRSAPGYGSGLTGTVRDPRNMRVGEDVRTSAAARSAAETSFAATATPTDAGGFSYADGVFYSEALNSHWMSVMGAVRYPGTYLVTQGTTLAEVLSATGGLVEDADLREFELTSTTFDNAKGASTTTRTTHGGSAEELAKIEVRPFDRVEFRRVYSDKFSGSVRVEGEVRYPGVYNILRNEKLSSVLRRAGGMTDVAYPEGAVFLRNSVAQAEQTETQQIVADMRNQLLMFIMKPSQGGSQSPSADSIKSMEALMAQIEKKRALGRVPVVADIPALEKHPELDTLLESGDSITVPKQPSTVLVVGEVLRAGAQRYDASGSVEDYLDKAGGTTGQADTSRIIVVLPDGSVRRQSNSWLNFGFGSTIPPGSTIFVPRELDVYTMRLFITDTIQVFSQLATTAAALAVLSKQ